MAIPEPVLPFPPGPRDSADDLATCFLPDLCAPRPLLVLVIATELLVLLLVLGRAAPLTDFWGRFGLLSLYAQWIALGAAVLLCLLRRPLGALGHARGGVLAWGLVLTVAALVAATAHLLLPPGFAPDLWLLLIQSVAIAGILSAVALHYLYQAHRQRALAVAGARARLQALQVRMRPHFLFNTLNSIASLVRAEPAAAEEMIADLADLLRAGLDDSASTTLARELELTHRYLDIERMRMGPRLRVQWSVTDAPLQALLPPLSLQPLVENAVRHGIEPSETGGEVIVSVAGEPEQVRILVRSPLPDGDTPPGLGMAMANLQQRLQLAFGDRAWLRTGAEGGMYQAAFGFPRSPPEPPA
jgi:two-component system sensor histidine kinase AlgZ